MIRSRKVTAIAISVLIISSLGAYLLLGSGGRASPSPHVIAIDRVAIDRADAPTGFLVYAILTNDSNLGKDTWNVNPSSFEVLSNGSSAYAEVSTALPGTDIPTAIPAGQHRVIELLFHLPVNQSPVRLTYDDLTTKTRTSIGVPAASGWVSTFEDIADVTKTGSGNYVGGVIAYAVLLNTSNPTFGSGERVSYSFFTGDRVTVGIELEYYKQPADPASIMISSVTNTDGFTVVSMASSVTNPDGLVVSVKPSLPVTMTGWGSRAEIEVTFLAPDESYSGALHFVIGFSSPAP